MLTHIRHVAIFQSKKLHMAGMSEPHVLPKGGQMGQKEHPLVWYYDQNPRFAGEQRLKRFRPNVKGEKICMCRAIDILIQDGEQRGEKRG